jgi:hypothetical protein
VADKIEPPKVIEIWSSVKMCFSRGKARNQKCASFVKYMLSTVKSQEVVVF